MPRPGYWDSGKWFGYVPAHVKYARRPDRPSVSPSQTSLKNGPTAKIVDPLAEYEESAARTGQSQATATAGPGLLIAQRAIIPASLEESVPVEVHEILVDEQISMPAPAVAMESYSRASYWTDRIWGRAEYLGWWTDRMNVPPLVTTGDQGVLGRPGTIVLFGDTGLNSDARSGGRFTLGLWNDPSGYRGLEVTYTMLGAETTTLDASNDDFTILGRPFFDTVGGGAQNANLIVDPGVSNGFVSVTASTEFQGIEVLFRRPVQHSWRSKTDFLWGYRWTQLEDNLLIDESLTTIAAPVTTIDLFDRFDTRNSFHGAEFGVNMERLLNPFWSLELLGKIAIGNTNSVAVVSGQATTTIPPAAPVTTSGGLLAQPTNIGTYERDSFAMVSEFGITLRRRMRYGLEATFGYTFVYWSDVARAGDQIDFDVNSSQFPPGPLVGAPRPAFSFQTTDFWAQGLHAGLEYRF